MAGRRAHRGRVPGYCVVTWPYPADFKGERIDGEPQGFCDMHGLCDMSLPSGARIQGEYWHGLPIGRHVITLPDGTSHIVMMLDDARLELD